MRVFLIAVLATVILTVGSIFALNTAQRTAAAAYTTEGARICCRGTGAVAIDVANATASAGAA